MCFVDYKTIQCKQPVHAQLTCNHTGLKMCCQNVEEVICTEACARQRECGHMCCGHKCHEHNLQRVCGDCERIERERKRKQLEAEEEQRKANKAKVEAQIKKMQEEAQKYRGV